MIDLLLRFVWRHDRRKDHLIGPPMRSQPLLQLKVILRNHVPTWQASKNRLVRASRQIRQTRYQAGAYQRDISPANLQWPMSSRRPKRRLRLRWLSIIPVFSPPPYQAAQAECDGADQKTD